MPSLVPSLNGKSVDMSCLNKTGVAIMDYRGLRYPISPAGSCVSSEHWGFVRDANNKQLAKLVNRTIEKIWGHIFVVSKKFLAEFIDEVHDFCQVK